MVVPPIATPDAGSKKSLAGILPSVPRAPVTKPISTLLKLAFVHTVLESHEFPVLVWSEMLT